MPIIQNAYLPISGGVCANMSVEVLDTEQLRIVIAANQRKYLAQRSKGANAVSLRIALQQARLG